VLRAQAGDREAAEELFRRLLPRVRKCVALRMGCRERELSDREDIVQETMLDAVRSLAGFELRTEGALCHWLATLVQNNLNDHQRRRQARKREALRVDPAASRNMHVLSDSVFGVDRVTPGDHVAAAELERRLEDALLALGERERRAIELRKVCGLSFDDIAKELGFGSASSARSLFSRAMAELSKHL
jgi:RNA polymerase sigma factor (sigma-70 family)